MIHITHSFSYVIHRHIRCMHHAKKYYCDSTGCSVKNYDVQDYLKMVQGCIKKIFMYYDLHRLLVFDILFLFIIIINRNLFILYTVDIERTFNQLYLP